MEILNTCLTEFNQEDYDRRRRREARNEMALEVAKNMLKKAIPIETIAECVELPVEKIKELAVEN